VPRLGGRGFPNLLGLAELEGLAYLFGDLLGGFEDLGFLVGERVSWLGGLGFLRLGVGVLDVPELSLLLLLAQLLLLQLELLVEELLPLLLFPLLLELHELLLTLFPLESLLLPLNLNSALGHLLLNFLLKNEGLLLGSEALTPRLFDALEQLLLQFLHQGLVLLVLLLVLLAQSHGLPLLSPIFATIRFAIILRGAEAIATDGRGAKLLLHFLVGMLRLNHL